MKIEQVYNELKATYGEHVSMDEDGIFGQTETGWFSIVEEDGVLMGDHEHSEYQNWMYDSVGGQELIATIANIIEDEK